MKEFRLQIRIKNNLLVKRREDLGLSLKEASKEMGISLAMLMNYENLKADPLHRSNLVYKDSALKIADFYKCMPEDLWPETVLRVEKNRIQREVSAAQIGHLLGISTVYASLPPDELCEFKEATDEVNWVLDQMNPREKDMVMRYHGMGEYDEHTFEKIASHYNLSANRVQQIINKVYRKMGHWKYDDDGGYWIRLKMAMESMANIRCQTNLARTYEDD